MSNQATKTIIFECPRIQSIGVNNSNEDYNNKSKWTNNVPPTLLKRGDTLNLQQVLINVAGADSNAISFENSQTTPNNGVLDNYSLMEIGYYLNHNGINSLGLPFKYKGEGGAGEFTGAMQFDTAKKDGEIINVAHGSAKDLQYFADAINSGSYTGADPIATGPRDCESANIHQSLDGERYAKVDPDYKGWVRTGGNKLATSDVKLMSDTIPFDIDAGFIAPTALADTMTLTMNRTINPSSRTQGDLFVPFGYQNRMDGNPGQGGTKITQQHFNGYCLKTINANLQRQNTNQHFVYGNICTDNPYKWKYGTRLLSCTTTYEFKNDPYLPDPTDDNILIKYPVFIWNRFIGNDPETLDIGVQYSNYSPFQTSISSRPGNEYLIETTGFSTTYADFNDIFVDNSKGTTTANGGSYVVKNGDNYQILANTDSAITDLSTMIFVDNDSNTTDDIIAWNRFYNLSGTYDANEHQIFKTTDIGQPGGSSPYTFSGAGAGEPSELWFSYEENEFRTIFAGVDIGGLGFTGNVFIKNLLIDGVGIEEDLDYTISFTQTLQSGSYGDGLQIQVSGTGTGVPTTIFNTDGDKTLTFTATGSSSAEDAIQIAVFYPNLAGVIKLTNIQIKSEGNLNDDDQYIISDVFTGPEAFGDNMKIYTLQKTTASVSNTQCVITNNTIPVQTPTYTGVDFNRTYRVATKGLILSFSGGVFRAITAQAGRENIALLYNDDDPNFTYWLYQGFSDTTSWVVYRLSKWTQGIPQNNDVIGTIQSNGAIMKNKYRNGQQYYDFAGGNSWSFASNFIDFTLGNTWNTRASLTGFALTATQHIGQGLSIDRIIYSFQDGGNYTGGTVGHTFSFTGETGLLGSFVYDNVLQDNDNAGTIVSYYIQADFMNGLTGHFTTGTGISGDWTFTTSGGSSGNGTFAMVGGATFNLDPVNPVSNSVSAFDYDYKFDGVADFYMKTTTTGADAYNAGTYFRTTNSDTRMNLNFNGAWSFDNITGTIQFTEADGSVHQTLHVGATGTNPGTTTVSQTTNFTNHIVNPLPVIDGLSYAYDVVVNSVQYYLGMNSAGTDEDLEGKRGTLKWSTDGGISFNTTTWNWNGTTLIDMNGEGGNIPLTATGGTPTLTNIIEYATTQLVGGYEVPTDGRQYGSGYGSFGNTASSQPTPDVEYLGGKVAGWSNTEDVNEGFVYNSASDTLAGGGNGKSWKRIQPTANTEEIQIIENASGDILLNLVISNENIIPYGWVLFRSNKQTDFQTTGSVLALPQSIGFISNDATAIENVGQLKALKTRDSGTEGKAYPIFQGATSNVLDTATFKADANGNLNRILASIEKDQLLMTNIRFTVDNLKIINDWMRYNEVYEGTFEKRDEIIKDVKNFSLEVDIGWSDDTQFDFAKDVDRDVFNGQPLVQSYMKFGGKMGADDSGTGAGTNENDGCVYPRMTKSDFQTTTGEQRIKINTFWGDDYNDRVKSEGMFGFTYSFGTKLSLTSLKNNYTEQYNYCVENNVGVIPYIGRDGNSILCGFQTFQDYTGDELFKIQNFTQFGFSPMFFDGRYVVPMNPVMVGTGATFTYSSDVNDYTNAINIGSSNPTVSFNSNLNKFEFQSFHFPVQFNKETGTDNNIGEVIARLFDDAGIVYKDYLQNSAKGQDKTDRNIGIHDSQAGIFLDNIYLNEVSSARALTPDDPTAVELTPENFYNCMWWKMGFTYYDLKPLNFNKNSFNNRFFNLYYNNTQIAFRDQAQRPLTTNSFLSISDAPASALFTQNGGGDTANPNKGTPDYRLGYNANQVVAIEVDSASMTAKSIPVNIGSGYYRVHVSNLPIDTMDYSSGGNSVNCVGYALLNYASSNQFFFSYAMDFGATITKDTVVSQISVEIRNDRGQLVRGLGDRSSVIFKVVREFDLDPPEPDPEVEELQDIEEQLKQLNKNQELENTIGELEDIEKGNLAGGIANTAGEVAEGIRTRRATAGAGVATRAERLPVMQDVELEQIPAMRRRGRVRDNVARTGPSQQQLENRLEFIDNLFASLIQTLVERVVITQEAKQPKDIANKISKGIANYFARNTRQLIAIEQEIVENGIEVAKTDPTIRNIIGGLKSFVITGAGQLRKNPRSNQPVYANISTKGAELITQRVLSLISGNTKPSAQLIDREIAPQIEQFLLNTGDLQIFAQGVRIPGERTPVDIIGQARKGQKPVERGYTKEQRLLISKTLDLDLESFLKVFLRLKPEQIRTLDVGQLRSLYNEAKQKFIQGKFTTYRAVLEGMRQEINDSLGGEGNRYANNQLERLRGEEKMLPGPSPAKPRRTPQEKKEAEEMGREDPRPYEVGRRGRKLFQTPDKRRSAIPERFGVSPEIQFDIYKQVLKQSAEKAKQKKGEGGASK